MKTAIPEGTRCIVAVVRARFSCAVHRTFHCVLNAWTAMTFFLANRPLIVASAQATFRPSGTDGSQVRTRCSSAPFRFPRP